LPSAFLKRHRLDHQIRLATSAPTTQHHGTDRRHAFNRRAAG